MPLPAPPDASADPRLQRLDRLSHYLDNAFRIPGIGYRVGYDALIGLIPGIGDLIGTAISAYIVLEAARLRLPLSTVARMAANVGIEALVGTVPVLGDLFDATWKANTRNMRLVRERVGTSPVRARASDKRFFAGIVVALVLLVVALGAGVVFLLQGLGALLGL